GWSGLFVALPDADDIEWALNQQGPPVRFQAATLLGQPEQQLSFVEQHRLRGIQVFGRACQLDGGQRCAAYEPGEATGWGAKGQPARSPESVAKVAAAPAGEARCHQFAGSESELSEMVDGSRPAGRGEARAPGTVTVDQRAQSAAP